MELSVSLCEKALNEAGEVLTKVLGSTIKFTMPKIKKITFSRAIGFWAEIHFNNDKSFDVKYSKPLFQAIPDSREPYKNLVETSIHELIHTIPGCDNHGNKFKAIAILVTSMTKYQVWTKTNRKERGVEEGDDVVINTAKYIVTCPCCGHKFYMHRKPKYIENFERSYRCGYCKSKGLIIKQVR